MLKKLSFFALACVLGLLLASTASAERKQFTDFSIDVAAGWDATEHTDDKGNKTVLITNAAKGMTLMIGIEKLEAGATHKNAADKAAAQVNGTVTEEDGGFSIAFKDAKGQEGEAAIVVVDDTSFLGIAITGGSVDDPDVSAMLDSMESPE